MTWPDKVPPAGPQFHTHKRSRRHRPTEPPMASPTILTIHHPSASADRSRTPESGAGVTPHPSPRQPQQEKDIWPTSPIRNTQIHKTKVPLACHGDKKKDEVSVGIATSRSCCNFRRSKKSWAPPTRKPSIQRERSARRPMDQTRARRYQTPDSEKTDACRQPSPSWLSRTRIIRTAGAKLRVNWNDDGLQRRVEPQHVCLRSAQRGFAPSSTEQDTSCGSCRPCCGTAGQPGWRAQTPHGHPRWSWPSTRGTCKQRSSYGSPHPIKLLAWYLVMQGGMPVLVG